MSTTKRWALHGSVSGCIDYVTQPHKTEDEYLITGINCGVATAKEQMEMTRRKFHIDSSENDRVGYHIIQSFSLEDDVEPETANEIGCRLVEELYEGYEAIVATHVDRLHIHNHIVINSVNKKTGLKLSDRLASKEGLYNLRRKNDELSRAYGLSTLDDSRISRFKKNKYLYRPNSNKEHIREKLTSNLMKADSLEELAELMRDDDYDVLVEPDTLKVRNSNEETRTNHHYIRTETLNDGEYSKENIERFYECGKPSYNGKPLIGFIDEQIYEKKMDSLDGMPEEQSDIIPSVSQDDESRKEDDEYSKELAYLDHDPSAELFMSDQSYYDFIPEYQEPEEDAFIMDNGFFELIDESDTDSELRDISYYESLMKEGNDNLVLENFSVTMIDPSEEVLGMDDFIYTRETDRINQMHTQEQYLDSLEDTDNIQDVSDTFDITISKKLIIDELEKANGYFIKIPQTNSRYYMYMDKEGCIESSNEQILYSSIDLNRNYRIYNLNGEYLKIMSGKELRNYWNKKKRKESKKFRESRYRNKSDNDSRENDRTAPEDNDTEKTSDSKSGSEEKQNSQSESKPVRDSSSGQNKSGNRFWQRRNRAGMFGNRKPEIRSVRSYTEENGDSSPKTREADMMKVDNRVSAYNNSRTLIDVHRNQHIERPISSQTLAKVQATARYQNYQDRMLSQLLASKKLSTFADVAKERMRLMNDIEYFNEKISDDSAFIKKINEIKTAINIYNRYHLINEKNEKLIKSGSKPLSSAYLKELMQFRMASDFLAKEFRTRNPTFNDVRGFHVMTQLKIREFNQYRAIVKNKTAELNVLNDYAENEDISKRGNVSGFTFARKRISPVYSEQDIAEMENDELNQYFNLPDRITEKVEIVIPYLDYTGEFSICDIINRTNEACHIYLDSDSIYTLHDEMGNELEVTGERIQEMIEDAKNRSYRKYKGKTSSPRNKYASKYTRKLESEKRKTKDSDKDKEQERNGSDNRDSEIDII